MLMAQNGGVGRTAEGEGQALPRILCVDDEPRILDGLALNLRRQFQVKTAVSGADALAILEQDDSIVVVVSDMRMPGMNGAELLHQISIRAPDVTRVLLTGHSDMEAAAAAVNEGQIFRFLIKPCPPDTLTAALHASVEHHHRRLAERPAPRSALAAKFGEGDVRKIMASIWSTVFGLELGASSSFRDGEESIVTAFVLLSGNWDGALLLECSRELAHRCAARMFDVAPEALSEDEVNDALGEVVNMAGGNFKNLIHGDSILSLPAVVDGRGHSVKVPGSRMALRVAFESDGAALQVSILQRDVGNARVEGS